MRREDVTWSALNPELFCNIWQATSNIMAVNFYSKSRAFFQRMADLLFAVERCEGETEEDVP
jgi:hypothetical protein